ncbi:MAG TPA: hypothetical protein DD473_13160 [Planctomycetaceae bacterium]|nr:hypothetical protein [Planctomycetaceae bacterium]
MHIYKNVARFKISSTWRPGGSFFSNNSREDRQYGRYLPLITTTSVLRFKIIAIAIQIIRADVEITIGGIVQRDSAVVDVA